MKAKKQHSKIPGKRSKVFHDGKGFIMKNMGTKARELIKGWPRGRSVTSAVHIHNDGCDLSAPWPFGCGLPCPDIFCSKPAWEEYHARSVAHELEVRQEIAYHKEQQRITDVFIRAGKPLEISVQIAVFDPEKEFARKIARRMIESLRGVTLNGIQARLIKDIIAVELSYVTRYEYTSFRLDPSQLIWREKKLKQLTHSRVADDLEVHPGYPGIQGVDW